MSYVSYLNATRHPKKIQVSPWSSQRSQAKHFMSKDHTSPPPRQHIRKRLFTPPRRFMNLTRFRHLFKPRSQPLKLRKQSIWRIARNFKSATFLRPIKRESPQQDIAARAHDATYLLQIRGALPGLRHE